MFCVLSLKYNWSFLVCIGSRLHFVIQVGLARSTLLDWIYEFIIVFIYTYYVLITTIYEDSKQGLKN